jgi:hypothetical protein
MMMMASPEAPDRVLYAVLPPGFYFRLATGILKIARVFYGLGILNAAGLTAALGWSHGLSRAGMGSWRQRRHSAR